MKFNRTSLIAVIALGGLVAFGTFVKAEDKPEAKPHGKAHGDMKERGAKMAEELGLNEEQKAKMAEVMKEFGPKYKAIGDDASLSKEDKMAKMKALSDERKAKIKEFLTPEQIEKLQKLEAAHRPGGPKGDHKPEKKSEAKPE
ncbi:MAG: hypothetical protein NTZ16_09035 [Verrucomicrobia bacterium]|nr:hypothetical protein [Verrucomicrobiota bacterium]